MRGNTCSHHSLMWGTEAVLEGSRNKSVNAGRELDAFIAVRTKRKGNQGPTELLSCVLFLLFINIRFQSAAKAVLGIHVSLGFKLLSAGIVGVNDHTQLH